MRVLVAGDHFVTNDLVAAALHDVPGLDIRTLTLPWPLVPFGPVAEVDEASGGEDELIAALSGVEVAVTQMAPFTARVLAAADALKLLVVCRGGPVNVNLDAAAAAGVTVRSTPGRNAVAAAEHTIALMLAALRQIPDRHNGVLAGEWRSDLYALDQVGGELGGSTVGLIGYGAIGRRVGRILAAFDARVLVHDPYADPATLDGATAVGSKELLERSSVVSLHARLTPETAGMVGAAELARLPRGAVLVNTARGGLLDYAAVVDALESGHLGAAAFDVFDAEPLPATSRLRKAPRVVLTPHLAGATRQTAERAARLAADAVRSYR
ncbi:D-3-phosphoglycerate dehydrogenase [Asanoa ferruginea]|uniref:D-3-phosphoglycerate dehydrogenase n=1 Tax=Asanoa ferruginea TaxID=53367 RepID=A0A3D9ZDZ2_9ACTN|nr:2-hydroxyacid dehydrogenase [Asanoa ferruginea]REF94734.1 D-3-phosphoglycerate dehydrogenase [Asanoa ferruginea]GIF45689.1 oxidoreductase [Asanoa ferruginea]